MNLFTEEGMKKALRWLIGLYEPDDYEAYDEDEIGEDGGLCLTEVCQALRDKFQTVYQYTISATAAESYSICEDACSILIWKWVCVILLPRIILRSFG